MVNAELGTTWREKKIYIFGPLIKWEPQFIKRCFYKLLASGSSFEIFQNIFDPFQPIKDILFCIYIAANQFVPNYFIVYPHIQIWHLLERTHIFFCWLAAWRQPYRGLPWKSFSWVLKRGLVLFFQNKFSRFLCIFIVTMLNGAKLNKLNQQKP